jgi:hypothetical protein
MDEMTSPAPAGWLEALARSEARLAAGEIMSGDAIMRELREAAERLEARAKNRGQRGAAPRR